MPEHAPIFFDNWYNVGRAVILSVIGFTALMLTLRVSGKRTLSKLNVFDFVFVVAVGSVFAATLVEKDVTLIEGFASLLTLVVIQVILAKVAACSPVAARIINGAPTILFSKGEFIPHALRKERVTEEEVRAAIREEGMTTIDDVEAVVLENDGTLTVAWKSKHSGSSSLIDVEVPEDPRRRRRQK